MPIVVRWLLRLGPANPIAVRLVTNGSRRARHHYIRIAYLGILIAVLLLSLLSHARGDQLDYRLLAAAGARSFELVAYLQIALICILAPVFMAGAIAQEADPRTWDILLATPLGATEIVLGNLFGRLFFIIALLFSSLPLFAVTQYFGGVAGQSIFLSYLIAACAALLVGSMAIALAVSRLAGRRAVFAFYVAVVSYLAVTFAIDVINRSGHVTAMTALNPFLAVNALLDSVNYSAFPEGSQTGLAVWFLERPIATWCILSSSLSVALMVASTVTVRIGGLSGIGVGGTIEGKAGLFARLFRRSGARAPRSVWHNPIAWRESAGRNDGVGSLLLRYGFIAAGLLWAVAMVLLLANGTLAPSQFRLTVFFTLLGELAVIALIAMNMAATSVSREREDGTLDILLTTPVQASEYLLGKLKGMITYLVPMLAVPIVTGFIVGGFVLVDQLRAAPKYVITVQLFGQNLSTGAAPTASIPLLLPEIGLIILLSAVPFTAFCVVIGMLWSLRSKGQIASVVSTVGVVATLSTLVGLCAWNAAASVPVFGPTIGALSPASAVFAAVFPEVGMAKMVREGANLEGARIALLIGGIIAAACYLVVVWSIKGSMTRNFDMTVRRLAGLK